MGQITLKNIIHNSNDLFEIKVHKQNKMDKSTWFYEIVDERWKGEPIYTLSFNFVFLRRGDCFFMGYECDDFPNTYFIDPRSAMFRTSVTKYLSNLVQYQVYSNDISQKKNDPSFKVTETEMKNKNINNFLDLCYEYNDYSAIGTGYTRNLRNLVVMDIDVDCTRPDNKEDLTELLYMFGKYNNLPDFIIFNKESKHVQLQWLIKNLEYKTIDQEIYINLLNDLNHTKNKNCRVNNRKQDFMKLSESGIIYRRFTMALCDIKKKRKFGDKNYTFWKAKNPMCALKKKYDLELKMPIMKDGKIQLLSDKDMEDYFSTKEMRQMYFEEAPSLDEWYERIAYIMDPIVKKISDEKVKDIKDATNVTEEKQKRKKAPRNYEEGSSRNTFVLECARNTTWDVAREFKVDYKRIKHMSPDNMENFKSEVYKRVRQQYKDKDFEYRGNWPGTTHKGEYSMIEFKKTFASGFEFAINKMNLSVSYSILDREKSLKTRQKRMNTKLMIVNELMSRQMSRNELLKQTNICLQQNNMKTISLSTLKRYISIIDKLTDEERSEMIKNNQG